MNIIPSGVGSLLRFLIGIFLLQGVTGLLVYTALSTDWTRTWPLFLLLAVSIGTLVAFWFNTIVAADRHRTVSRISERFSKERERIRVKAEQVRAKVGRDHARLQAKARGGTLSANLKTGAVVGGALGLGVAMLLAQFVTVGLLTLTTAGGAALGYSVRVRQEKRIVAKRLAAEDRLLLVEPETESPRRRLLGRKSESGRDEREPL
ncbi:MAG: hypothetical protein EOM91_05640 [Sphingobacteriia bacterium]|nr:hypothetical protein [Sphingobacteriia bacterium]NCC40122.1 hypothetical protein [Gammaproteobacteria bacterium]